MSVRGISGVCVFLCSICLMCVCGDMCMRVYRCVVCVFDVCVCVCVCVCVVGSVVLCIWNKC